MKKLSISISVLIVLCGLIVSVVCANNKLQDNITATQEKLSKQELLEKEFQKQLKLAQEGDSVAQNDLGILYAEGEGVGQDDAEAIEWFLKSAEQGNSYAACNLALHYGSGRGVKRDVIETLKWCFISHSLDGLKCHPDDFIKALKPSKLQKTKASELAVKWLRNHPNFTNNFGEKPWMVKGYKFKSNTLRF